MTYLGLRPGEKLYEELLVKTEELDKTPNSMIFIERDAPLCEHDINGLINNFFLEKMLPVVIGVERKIILFAPLPDSKAAGFLICKSDGPFLKMDLMKFLSCITNDKEM